MRFPLSLVLEFARQEGYEVVSVPVNLKETFEWVAVTDVAAGRLEGRALRVLSVSDAQVPGMSLVVDGAQQTQWNSSALVLDCDGKLPMEVAEELQLYLMDIYQWVEDMHHALERHCDCSELLSLSEPILKNFISVSDSAFFHIAHTPGIKPIEDASRYFIEHGRYSAEVIETVGSSGLSELWSRSRPFSKFVNNAINPKPSIEHVYHLNSQYAAHLVMVCEDAITEGQEFLFCLLIGPIGTALDYMWRTDNPLKKRYTSFLSDVIHGGPGHRESARRQAESLGIPLSGLFKVCLVSEPWRASSEGYFAERALALLPGCWTIADKKDIVILLHESEKGKPGKLSSLEEKAFELAIELDTQVGVSRKFFDLFRASAALEEARIALKYGKARYDEFLVPGQNRADDASAHVFRFKRYFPFYVGDTQAYKADFFRKNNLVEEVIGAIERDDAEQGTSDALILRAYLRSSCRVKVASESLGMHRNSVGYRLKHIERAYDLDLSDSDEIAFLIALLTMPR